MDYKVGDKVRVRSDLEWWKVYNSSTWRSCYFGYCMEECRGKEFAIVLLKDDWDIFLEWYDYNWIDSFFEQSNIKKAHSKPTYERKAERSDGITFERNAIWGRSLREITESIAERKESIKRDESLLRSHRSLFSKKK